MNRNDEHRMHRIGWLRATVLGANDGIVSTASLVIGVAAAGTSADGVLVAGVAGLVAGAMSMAAGEYVSVSSQADTERADLALERQHLAEDYAAEHRELACIYEDRGVQPDVAAEVAQQLMDHDALDAHARDELGIFNGGQAAPVQAALSSAAAFTTGASLPLAGVLLAPPGATVPLVAGLSLLCLSGLGALAARAGGAPVLRGAARVGFWGALAMAATATVGTLFGVAA